MRQLTGSEPTWMRRLKIRHLEVFVTLVETGSQSATATQLNITQPALSKWLRELEEDIGAALFERGRRLTPTAYGEIVLQYARRVLGDSVRMGDELQTFRAGQSGRVRVGLLRSAAATLIPKVITSYLRIAPDVRISLFEDTLDNLLPRLERRELDCIIGRLQGRRCRPRFSPKPFMMNRSASSLGHDIHCGQKKPSPGPTRSSIHGSCRCLKRRCGNCWMRSWAPWGWPCRRPRSDRLRFLQQNDCCKAAICSAWYHCNWPSIIRKLSPSSFCPSRFPCETRRPRPALDRSLSDGGGAEVSRSRAAGSRRSVSVKR